MLLSESNLLILDEPTNHLDNSTKELFQKALLEYGGTIIIVSHDRAFLDDLVERVIEPRLRVRAPKVAAAHSLADKLRAYWGTLATPPDPAEQAAALLGLDELQTRDDAQIAADTRDLIG